MLAFAYLLFTFAAAIVICLFALPPRPRVLRATGAATVRVVVGAIAFGLFLRPWGIYPPTIARSVLLSIGVYVVLRTAAWWATIRFLSPRDTAPKRIWALVLTGVIADFLLDLFLPDLLKWLETVGSTVFI